jgi:21S rRNA (GM2251-2'-O)-methyltransferase
MVLSSVLGSTLLRTQQTHLPQTFRRYKSLTAAIERGKQGGPDRPFRPRTRPPPEDFEGARPQPRFERRAEHFGPSKTEDREKSRSSRFGRIGPPRSRDGYAPSRFQDEIRPWRREDGVGASSEGPLSGKRFDDEQRPSSDRIEGRERPPYRSDDRPRPPDRWEGRSNSAFRSGDRPPRQDRGGFGQRNERPSRREGQFESGEKRPFDRDNREKRQFDRDSNFRSQDRFSDRNTVRGPPRESFGRRETGDRPDRSGRSWTPRNETSLSIRGRSDGDRSKGYQRRDASHTQADTPTLTTRPTVTPESIGRVPEVLPYSTAASEFLYGHSSVVAALKANRRKLYKLYVHTRGSSRDGLMARVRALKLFHITEEVGDEYLRAMDKASSGRPHNGLVLESSPLPVPPITELKAVSMADESFGVTVDSQSAEDVLVNGKQETYSYKSAGWRQPLILYVDGVVRSTSCIYE